MSEPERRVSYIIEQAPKGGDGWGHVETYHDKERAERRLAVFRETRLDMFWDFRVVQVDEVRTVIE